MLVRHNIFIFFPLLLLLLVALVLLLAIVQILYVGFIGKMKSNLQLMLLLIKINTKLSRQPSFLAQHAAITVFPPAFKMI